VDQQRGRLGVSIRAVPDVPKSPFRQDDAGRASRKCASNGLSTMKRQCTDKASIPWCYADLDQALVLWSLTNY